MPSTIDAVGEGAAFFRSDGGPVDRIFALCSRGGVSCGESLSPERLGPSAWRGAELTGQKLEDAVWELEGAWVLSQCDGSVAQMPGRIGRAVSVGGTEA